LDNRKSLVLAYQKIFNTEEGKVVLDNLNVFGRLKRSCTGRDALDTANKNGRREFLLHIHQFLDADPTEGKQSHA